MTVTLLIGPEPSTSNTDNNPRDMVPIAQLEPSATPFTLFMDKMGSKPATNPKFEWLENENMPRITTLSASATSAATAWGVTADIFRVGDYVKFPALGQGILVTATAAGAITATKIVPATQVSAASSAELYLVSNANAEGATLREIKYPQLVTASNYAQIFRTPSGITGTEEATQHYSGPERARLQNDAGREQARQIEQAFFHSNRSLQGTNQRITGGLDDFIATNVTNDSGGLTEAEWQTFLQTGFRYGTGSKVAFCSPKVIAALEGYARSNLRVVNADANVYGVKMSTYQSGQGDVMIVGHKDWLDSTVYNGYCYLVDMDAVQMRPLRSTRLKLSVQAPDYDGFKDEWLTEVGLQVTHERRHALLTGVS